MTLILPIMLAALIARIMVAIYEKRNRQLPKSVFWILAGVVVIFSVAQNGCIPEWFL